MPSGISHILLSRNLPMENDRPYRFKRKFNTRYFQIGSIAPDLPYASIADNNFLDNNDELADYFHFAKKNQETERSPNKLPILGLRRVKEIVQKNENKKANDALFWFMVGFISHVIADGVFHPFVMDKVGPYEGKNKADHRALEMGIDVLLFKHFTHASGRSIEASYAGMDRFIAGFNELIHSEFVFEHFADFIQSVYGIVVTKNEIKDWVIGISRLFCLSMGKWPAWFRQLEETAPFVFRKMEDLEGNENNYLVLKKPRYWDKNFLKKEEVKFIDDCVPRFNYLMKSLVDRAYEYVYEDGLPISEVDIAGFSLDTGRNVDDPNNTNLTPILWEVV